MQQLRTVPTKSAELPPLPAVQTQHEHRHGLIRRPRLLLRAGRFDGIAPAAREQTGVEQVTLDAALIVDLILVGRLPIEPARLLQIRYQFGPLGGLAGGGQILGTHLD